MAVVQHQGKVLASNILRFKLQAWHTVDLSARFEGIGSVLKPQKMQPANHLQFQIP